MKNNSDLFLQFSIFKKCSKCGTWIMNSVNQVAYKSLMDLDLVKKLSLIVNMRLNIVLKSLNIFKELEVKKFRKNI